jgi:hypothetical protein
MLHAMLLAAAFGSAAPVLSVDYMVGKWSAFGEDCAHTIEFKKDGTVMTPIGIGKWKVGAGKLTFDYGDGKPTVSQVEVLGPDRIAWTSMSGGKETEKRCK